MPNCDYSHWLAALCIMIVVSCILHSLGMCPKKPHICGAILLTALLLEDLWILKTTEISSMG